MKAAYTFGRWESLRAMRAGQAARRHSARRVAIHFLELKDVDKPVVWILGEPKGNENV
jgi:hypothetical protein